MNSDIKPDLHQNTLQPNDNKFHKGNGKDGKHYWLTPPKLMEQLQLEFNFNFDACPFPKPDDFDGLTCEWGESTYVNPPFGSIIHQGKKKGPTAWMRKAIEEHKKGKRVVVVYPIDKWILMMIQAGAKITNLGDVKWVATEDGSEGKGTGRHIAQFVLDNTSEPLLSTVKRLQEENEQLNEAIKKINSLQLERPGMSHIWNEGYRDGIMEAVYIACAAISKESLKSAELNKEEH